MNGSLRIKTKIDNSDIDKDISQIENKIKKLQNNNTNYSKEQRALQAEVRRYEELSRKVNKYKQEISDLQINKNGSLQVTDSSRMAELQIELAEANREIEKLEPGVSKVYNKLDKIKQKQEENNEKIREYKEKIESIKTGNISSMLESMTGSTSKLIGKVLKWGVALFSVRSAYSMISRLSNTYLSENQGVANKIASIWGTLAEILGPAIDFIVNIIAKAVGYLAVFIKALTGIDIIANRNAKALKNQAKAQREVNKAMQSFDEANILQDTQAELSNKNADTSFQTPDLDPAIVEKLEAFAGKVRELKEAWDNLNPAVKVALGLLGATGLIGLLTRKRRACIRSRSFNSRNRWAIKNI